MIERGEVEFEKQMTRQSWQKYGFVPITPFFRIKVHLIPVHVLRGYVPRRVGSTKRISTYHTIRL